MSTIVSTSYRKNKIHPLKLALWVGCSSIMMMFVAFSSAYVVRQAAGNWLEFPLPDQFYWSTGIILLSSVVFHLTLRAFKQGRERAYKFGLIATFVLGLGFLFSQYLGWTAMAASGLNLQDNPSISFVYVISWTHAAHILGGIAVLTVALIHGFGLPFKVTEKRKLRLELSVTYWHFVDLLWIYVLVFFLLQQGSL